MNILHVIRSVDLSQGGPIESLIRSEAVWQRLGHQRELVSLDLPDDRCVAECPLPTHAMGSAAQRKWVERVPWLRYGFTPHLIPWLRRHVSDYDVVVVNGIWNYSAFAARRVLPASGVPYAVFTHGMLDPWFRRAYPIKHGCKQLVWWLSEGPLTHGACAVLSTSEGERTAAANAFWPSNYRAEVVGYGTAAPPVPTPAQTAAFRAAVPTLRRPFLLFLGRLHPKKGCDLLLRAYAQSAASNRRLDLVIAGPDCDGEAAHLARLAQQLGVADRVHWAGMLRDGAKWGALQNCDAFVLPSHGENFGVAVAEALACGKPVLVSDRVNIAPTILDAQAGLVAPDTLDGTATLLRRFTAMDRCDRAAMGARARSCFDASFDIEHAVQRTVELLAAMVESRAAEPQRGGFRSGFVGTPLEASGA